MKKIIFISILILMLMAPWNSFAASGSILSPWKKSGVNVSLARSTDNVGIGTAAPGGLLHLATPTIYLGQAIFEQASGDVDSFDLTFRKARGTIAAPTVITTADELGFINFAGYSGAGGYVTGAAIKAYSSGTVATTRVPANLRFYTGTDAAPTVLTERMRLDNLGNVGIGTISFGTSAEKTLGIFEGVAPTTSPADVSQVWSQNYNGAASNRLYERTEEGNSSLLALLSETGPSYGVAWNETTDSYTRLGRTSGHKIAATLPDEMLPIQANMKRCLLKDDGTINYFLYLSNSAFKVDGSTASV